MYIPNDDTQYYPFCTLQLVVETFEQSTKQKSQKLLSQLIRKRPYENLRTSVDLGSYLDTC